MTRTGLALLAISLTLASAPAAAAEWVSLDSAITPPSKLQVRAARLRGKEPKLPPPIRIKARLDRPAGDGPFPAVVLLHGCYGIQPYQRALADDLVALGYVVLQVDSYGPRRIETLCDAYSRMASVGQELDAYGALAYLAERPFVDSDRIAMLGWSVGATSVLLALDREKIHALFPRKFRAAVAFYPYCLPAQGPFVAPLLLLIGGVIGAQFGARFGGKMQGAQLRGLLALIVIGVCAMVTYDLVAVPEDLFSIGLGAH